MDGTDEGREAVGTKVIVVGCCYGTVCPVRTLRGLGRPGDSQKSHSRENKQKDEDLKASACVSLTQKD